MSSAAAPGTSNGIKRSATNDYQSSSTTTSSAASSSSPPPPEKRSYIVVESPLKLEAIASAEDLDVKVLRIQNKHLSERLVHRQKLEAELRERIEALQNRKAADDSKLCIVDRFWTQLDEDLRLIMEQFDAHDDKQHNKEQRKSLSHEAKRFLTKLNDWDKEELDSALKERVSFTTQTVAKLVASYDRLSQKYEQQLREFIRNSSSQEPMDTSSSSTTTARSNLQELFDENCKLKRIITQCQENVHTTGLENKQLEDKITLLENELKDLGLRHDEAEYELDKTRDKAFKLDRQLADAIVKITNIQKNAAAAAASGGAAQVNNHIDQNGQTPTNNSNSSLNRNEKQASITEKQLNDLEAEVEEQRELAASRLQELEQLNIEYQNSLKQIEKLKAEMKIVPESLIEQSNEYKMLQMKYSLIVGDNTRLKQALDETRALFESARAQFQRQMEQMESEELHQQKKLGNDLMQLGEQLNQVRKENDLLRIEYEQNVAANEQTGPINKEMRSLITTLQVNNKLVRTENQRYKKREQELQDELEKLKKQLAQLQEEHERLKKSQQQQTPTTVKKEPNSEQTSVEQEMKPVTDEAEITAPSTSAAAMVTPKKEEQLPPIKKEDESSSVSSAILQQKDTQIRELKDQMKRQHDMLKEQKSILEAYKAASKKLESPSSKKSHATIELDEAKLEIRRLRESTERLKKQLAVAQQQLHHHGGSGDDSVSHSGDYKRLRSLEEQVRDLHKNLSNKKQEEVALLNDMEITGQAFEDMQEQNVRLISQLREKDDANFKLVSERIKLENIQKILKEEKEILAQQVQILQEQQEAQMMVSKRLEEQLTILTQNQAIYDKEMQTLRHTCDQYMRQAYDNVQHTQDLKLSTQKYLCQLKEAQEQIAEKTETLASQSFNNKRSQEEIKLLQLKIERHKKYEMAASTDEYLQEELKEYREQLRCPSCKVKQKDAVLTKCFHVFCFDCLQKRYDTRQRKCPKCNHPFGANDFRKIYLS